MDREIDHVLEKQDNCRHTGLGERQGSRTGVWREQGLSSHCHGREDQVGREVVLVQMKAGPLASFVFWSTYEVGFEMRSRERALTLGKRREAVKSTFWESRKWTYRNLHAASNAQLRLVVLILKWTPPYDMGFSPAKFSRSGPGAEKADDTGSHREMVPRQQKKKEAGKLRILARQLTIRVVIRHKLSKRPWGQKQRWRQWSKVKPRDRCTGSLGKVNQDKLARGRVG